MFIGSCIEKILLAVVYKERKSLSEYQDKIV